MPDERAEPGTKQKTPKDAPEPAGHGDDGPTLAVAAHDLYDANREHVTRLTDALRARARREPLKTVLLAAGAGALFGILFA